MKKITMKGMMIRRAFCSAMALAMVFSSLVLPQGAITAYAEESDDGTGTPSGEDDNGTTSSSAITSPATVETTPSAVTSPAAVETTPSAETSPSAVTSPAAVISSSALVATPAVSSNKATQIKNGDFEVIPWIDYVYNGTTYTYETCDTKLGSTTTIASSIPKGVDEGWNTTEINPYNGNLFEVWPTGSPLDKNEPQKGSTERNGMYYIEMNTTNPAALYQDLSTQGGDVIKWTLQHADRANHGFQEQRMYVTIGAPQIVNGKIVAATGVGINIDTKIVDDDGKAEYRYDPITQTGAISGSAAFANLDELKGLSVTKGAVTWCTAAGIYVVPDGQDVTRFAFCADASSKKDGEDAKYLSGGNFLDNITFSTLVGKLTATKQDGGDVKVTGYWGDTDTSKRLVVDLGNENLKYVDMKEVCEKNFEITVPADMISSAGAVKVYHEDYVTATKTVPITHAHDWNYESGSMGSGDANKIYAFCAKNEEEESSGTHDCEYKQAEKKVYMTLNAPDAVYTGNAYKEARVSDWSIPCIGLATKPAITYYLSDGVTKTDSTNSGAASDGAAPKYAGNYRAKITIANATGTEDSSSVVTATKDFTISKLPIDTVAFTEPKTTSGIVPATTLQTANNAFYTGSISWTPSDGTFAYNKTYTATVTLELKDENKNGCKFVSPIKAPSGWRATSVNDNVVVFTKEYKIKPKITSVTAPNVITQLTELTTKEGQIASLPQLVPVEVEDNNVTGMAITWVLKKNTTYSNALSAENTFTWTIQESEYKNKYDTNTQKLTGDIKIKNPSHISHSWIYEGHENQLSAYCSLSSEPGCIYDSEHKLTLTLNASNATFSGSAYTGASIATEGQSAWTAAGLEIPTIQYEGDTGTTYPLSSTAPTAAGNYKAVLAVGEQRAEAAFQITSSGGGSGSGGDDPGSGGESGGGSGSGGSSGSGSGSGGSSGGGSGSGGSSGGGSGSGGSSGGSSGGGSTPSTPSESTDPTENFTIPVKNEQTVKVEAEIKAGTANVSEITNETIDKVVNNKDSESKIDTITIDLSGAKQEITGVTLSKESVKTLAETTAEANNGIETATIQLSKATVVLDNKTLETLVEQAKGTDIRLVVEDKDRKELNTVQQTSLSQHQVATTFEAYFVSEGQRIHDFKGGTAVVSIDFTPEAGKDPSFYHLVYVAENGEMTRYKTKYDTGKLMFTATHFSDYAVIYDTGEKNETVKPEEEEKTDSTDTDAKDDSSDTDAKATMDTSYSKLRLRVPTSTKTTNVLKWTKQTGADGYVIYGAPCDTKKQTYTVKELVTIENGSTTTWTHKKLKKATYYKYYIKAYKLENGKKVWLAKSKVVHSTTTGGKYGNAKAMKVNKTAVSLAEGKTFTIKAEQVIKDKPIAWHQNIKYESSNTEVASVTGKGVIKAKKTGTCYIYVYAQNGMYQRIKVTVS